VPRAVDAAQKAPQHQRWAEERGDWPPVVCRHQYLGLMRIAAALKQTRGSYLGHIKLREFALEFFNLVVIVACNLYFPCGRGRAAKGVEVEWASSGDITGRGRR
jgi:hypothetical protein